MNLRQAKKIFEQIVELCYEIENPRLVETVESIYAEVDRSDEIEEILSYCMEIQVVINEEDFLEEEEDAIAEIQEMIESLSE